MKKIILASNSSGRIELMKLLGIKFEVFPSDFDEKLVKIKNPKKLVKTLSLKKAQAVSSRSKKAIIIAADTVMVLKDEILTKPNDNGDAFKTLKKLSGARYIVITGLTIIDVESKYSNTISVETFVKMKKLKDSEIKAYIKTREPFEKAGSFAIQGYGGLFVKEISGDFFNIVGLPISKVREQLNNLGIKTKI